MRQDEQPPKLAGIGRWFAATLAVAGVVIAVQTWPYTVGARGDAAWLALATTTWPAVLGHAVLFAPAGYCEARLGSLLLGRGRVANGILLLAVIDVVILAIIAESAQLWIVGRTSNSIDLVAAAIGGAAGALVALYRSPR